MSFWSWLTGAKPTDLTDNGGGGAPFTVGSTFTPGDPDGVVFTANELTQAELEERALPSLHAAGWSGWPATWQTPGWSPGIQKLADTAWDCLDLNSRVLSTMPTYKTRDGRVVEPEDWMSNPDPEVYVSWAEFAKQLFWDYQMGEAFIYATARFTSGYPMFFRVLPPYMVKVEMDGASRRYFVGSVEITPDVLHIRYKSDIAQPHGVGPLDAAGARLTASCVMARYISEMVTAPPPLMTLSTDQLLNSETAGRIMDQWIESRTTYRGYPAVLDAGFELNTHQMNAEEMALLELAQFTDARIAVKLGVPPPLVGLPTGDSMTYSNVSGWTDHHDRLTLRPFATSVMSALSNWALGPGRVVELDRDEYSRPPLPERVAAYVDLHGIGAITPDEVREIEHQLYATGVPGGDVLRLPGGGA
jgi:HK97 family phage portal protein